MRFFGILVKLLSEMTQARRGRVGKAAVLHPSKITGLLGKSRTTVDVFNLHFEVRLGPECEEGIFVDA